MSRPFSFPAKTLPLFVLASTALTVLGRGAGLVSIAVLSVGMVLLRRLPREGAMSSLSFTIAPVARRRGTNLKIGDGNEGLLETALFAPVLELYPSLVSASSSLLPLLLMLTLLLPYTAALPVW
jgi:hypothetical protein